MPDLVHPMDRLDTLSSGLFSHTIFPPVRLAELLYHLKEEIIENFKEYELAITEIQQ